jgi:predicted P-loop ATPase
VLKDQTLTALRLKIAREFQLKIGKEAFQDFILTFATHDAFHPVRDYLDEVEAQWDGVPRIETMLSRYFGSEDTPLSRAMSKCHMIAAARRMRKPGTKHDVALILESEQGWGKSTGIEALASKPFFSDALPVGADSKETIERTSGIWIVELPELAGMEKRAVETVKAALSRNVDIARAAYGKIPERVPRAFVFWGSTNSEKYLRDATGNRRFWGVKCLRPVDVDAIRRDRDQLWAEAAMLESQGVSHVLDPALWGAAGIEQTARTVDNQFVDRLEAVLPEGDYSISKVAVYELLGVTSVNGHDGVRVGVEQAMKMLGFNPSKRVPTEDGKKLRGFRRGEPSGRVVTTRWSSEDHKMKPHMDYFDKTDEDDTEEGPA